MVMDNDEALKREGVEYIFRRYLIDFAARLVHTGRKIILKVTVALWERRKILELWKRCNSPPVITLA